ncbi:MAG: transposase, partial [Gammaproteobacteria bacterium]|nr:transposase [Gammaproteobacteria bacterium]
PGTVEKYSHGTPDDWVERNVYGGDKLFCKFGGVGSMLIIDVLLFGPLGLTIWAVQMLWIPIFAAGVINGLGHYSGYRNFETADTSTNIVPWGILIGGEELHNNHHAFGSSARFSSKPWEFDIGWMYIRIMTALGLARVKKLAPQPAIDDAKTLIDLDTVGAVISNRLHIMGEYARNVVNRVYSEEVSQAAGDERAVLKPIRRLLAKDESMLDDSAREQIAAGLRCSDTLEVVYQFKLRLAEIWNERTASQERLVAALQEWCRAAEETGIRALEEFAQSLRGYTLKPAAAR